MSFSVLAEICNWFPVSDGAGAFTASAVLRDRLYVRYGPRLQNYDYKYGLQL